MNEVQLFLGLLFPLLKMEILKQQVVGLAWVLCLSGIFPAHCLEEEQDKCVKYADAETKGA